MYRPDETHLGAASNRYLPNAQMVVTATSAASCKKPAESCAAPERANAVCSALGSGRATRAGSSAALAPAAPSSLPARQSTMCPGRRLETESTCSVAGCLSIPSNVCHYVKFSVPTSLLGNRRDTDIRFLLRTRASIKAQLLSISIPSSILRGVHCNVCMVQTTSILYR